MGARRGTRFVFTARHRQVLALAAEGKSNEQIAKELFVCRDTVARTMQQVFELLGARDRANAVCLGLRAGVIQ